MIGQRPSWLASLVSFALLWPALLAADLFGLRLYPHSAHDFVFGARSDDTMLQLTGFYGGEKTSDGIPYRWSEGQAGIGVRSFASIPQPVLTLKLGPQPPAVGAARPVGLALNDTRLVTLPGTAMSRRYELVLPGTALHDGSVVLGLATVPVHVAPDPRELGVRLDDLRLSWPAGSRLWPSRQTLLVQWVMLLLCIAALRRLALPRVVVLVALGTLMLLLGWVVGAMPLMPVDWETWAIEGALVVCGAAWGLPLLVRAVRSSAGGGRSGGQ